MKKAYDIRSFVLHGSSIKGDDEKLVIYSMRLDDIFRKLFQARHEIFLKSDTDIDEYFLSLLLQ